VSDVGMVFFALGVLTGAGLVGLFFYAYAIDQQRGRNRD